MFWTSFLKLAWVWRFDFVHFRVIATVDSFTDRSSIQSVLQKFSITAWLKFQRQRSFVPNQSDITKYTSSKLLFTFLVVMFRLTFVCKYVYIFSLFIAPLNHMPYYRQKNKWKILFLEKDILLQNLMLQLAFFFFLQNSWAVYNPLTKTKYCFPSLESA